MLADYYYGHEAPTEFHQYTQLPTEVHQMIIDKCDFQSLGRIGRTSWSMHEQMQTAITRRVVQYHYNGEIEAKPEEYSFDHCREYLETLINEINIFIKNYDFFRVEMNCMEKFAAYHSMGGYRPGNIWPKISFEDRIYLISQLLTHPLQLRMIFDDLDYNDGNPDSRLKLEVLPHFLFYRTAPDKRNELLMDCGKGFKMYRIRTSNTSDKLLKNIPQNQ